jgi:hypothetical protein
VGHDPAGRIPLAACWATWSASTPRSGWRDRRLVAFVPVALSSVRRIETMPEQVDDEAQ